MLGQVGQTDVNEVALFELLLDLAPRRLLRINTQHSE